MADEQDRAEALDEEEVGTMPPDTLLGAQAYGAAGAEPHAVEPVARRAAREEPEAGAAPERGGAGVAPEEAAIHDIGDPLQDFDSEVDDPQLEAAWQTDPPVDR